MEDATLLILFLALYGALASVLAIICGFLWAAFQMLQAAISTALRAPVRLPDVPPLPEWSRSFEHFCQLEILRTGNVAEIIVARLTREEAAELQDPQTLADRPNYPVRLLGFTAEAWRSDYVIYEQGWDYAQRFLTGLGHAPEEPEGPPPFNCL